MSTRKDAPPRPTGTGLAAQFFQWVWDQLAAGRFPLIDTPTVKWDRNSGGYAANIVPRGTSATGSGSSAGFAGDYAPTKTYVANQTVRVMVSDNLTFRFWFEYAAIKAVPVSQAIPAQQPPAYTLIATLPGAGGYNYVITYFLQGNGVPNGPGSFGDTAWWKLLSFSSQQYQAFPT